MSFGTTRKFLGLFKIELIGSSELPVGAEVGAGVWLVIVGAGVGAGVGDDAITGVLVGSIALRFSLAKITPNIKTSPTTMIKSRGL